MKLNQVMRDVAQVANQTEISYLCHDSNSVKNGALFFCFKGANYDGHDFIEEAIKKGAVAIVCEKPIKAKVPTVVVSSARSAMAKCAAAFYGYPSRKMKMIGITGTNGKTTTSYILKSIFTERGDNVGLIGTNAVEYGAHVIEANMTTPDPIELNETLYRMAESGVNIVVMEVSAHALALKKIDGIRFEVAVFTNLSRDHLDFFETMEKYGAAKESFFTPAFASSAVINIDDEYGQKMIRRCVLPLITYGCDNPADVFAIDLNMNIGGLSYVLNLFDDVEEIRFNLPGRFNMFNTLCAAATAKAMGVDMHTIVRGIRMVKKVDGRFHIINTTTCGVIIDFAHTDDGLKNILTTIREFAENRIITVFGCGGDRDRSKRPIMGEVVSCLSDFCYVTSDNPRSEDPSFIIGEVVQGILAANRNNYTAISDRKTAIKEALINSRQGDVILIAGKGAERTYEQNGIRYAYNDEDVVLKLIEEYHL